MAGGWQVRDPRGRLWTLTEAGLALAEACDGQTPVEALLRRGRERFGAAFDDEALRRFAAALGERGLLAPGARQPLPAPARHDRAAVRANDPAAPGLPDPLAALPPSSVPGSRAAPGLPEQGRLAARRPLAPRLHAALLALGRPLAGLAEDRRSILLTVAALAVLAVALVTHRLEAARFFGGAFGGWQALPHLLVSLLLVNAVAVASRAAAVERYTPEAARLGWRPGPLGLPRLEVDPDQGLLATRAVRLRLAAAAPLALAALISAALLLWFVLAPTLPVPAHQALSLALTASIALVLRLNPLAQADGYQLLAQALDQPDLHQQARLALRGQRRPWQQQVRPLSRRLQLGYGALALLFWLAVLLLALLFGGEWLLRRFDGLGFLLLMVGGGVLMLRIFRPSGPAGASLGVPTPPRRWTPRQRGVALGALVLLLLPYHEEPSGSFEVLPGERAEVSALVAGEVREVPVSEGDVVVAGQVLARIDPVAAEAELAAAEAGLARLEADLALARRGAREEEVEVARQKLLTATTAAEIARAQAQRMAAAFRRKSVTAQDEERARGAAELAEQQRLEAQRGLDLVASPVTIERIAALEAGVREAQARLVQARRARADTEIKAPIAGRVVSQRLREARGQFLQRGETLAVIEDRSRVLAEVRIPEAALARIRLDGPASAKPWAYPGREFEGRVLAIAPSVEEGRYSRVVRVQVELRDPEGLLKSGMSGNAKVEGGWSLTGLVFTRALMRFLLVELWSWIP
ncbi:MAG TPA: efflux RND transporter periplasmic adaptor subunit [Nevskiaceae bacterium]|nr:efflux RND transporter periplasmic adaptor subunit [Nevskiaceae bacterium]